MLFVLCLLNLIILKFNIWIKSVEKNALVLELKKISNSNLCFSINLKSNFSVYSKTKNKNVLKDWFENGYFENSST